MARLRLNFISGTVADNPLTLGALTMTVPSTFPVVASPDYMAVTLDPYRIAGAPEVIWVTAHTGGATTASIVRGQEGTAARAHALGMTWTHTATNRDYVNSGNKKYAYLPADWDEAWLKAKLAAQAGLGQATVLCLGESIMAGMSSLDENTNAWPERLRTSLLGSMSKFADYYCITQSDGWWGNIGTPPAPVLTALAGSTDLPAGTYIVGVTYTNGRGETTISSTTSQVLTAGQALKCDLVNVYSGWGPILAVKFWLTAAPATVNLGLIGTVNNPPDESTATITLTVKATGNGASAPGVNTAMGYQGTPPIVLQTGIALWGPFGYTQGPLWNNPVTAPIVTFNTPYACTAIDILYVEPTVAGSFTYAIDGEADVTVTLTTPTVQRVQRVRRTGLANTTHTVRINTQSGSWIASIIGFAAYPTGVAANGLGWARMYHPSSLFMDMVRNDHTPPDGMAAFQGNQIGVAGAKFDNTFGFPSQPDLALLECAGNDAEYAQLGGCGVAQMEDGYRRLVQALRRGKKNCSIMFVYPHIPDGVNSDAPASASFLNTENWELMRNQIERVARNLGCAIANIQYKWGQTPHADGFISAGLHPLDAGHADMAAFIGSLL